jgi:hypothetical protein
VTDRPRNVVVGYGACPCCAKASLPVKANKKGHLYVYCPPPADGGCACATQARSDRADAMIAQKFVSKWVNADYRRVYLAASGPVPARVSGRVPKPAHAPAQKRIASVSRTSPAPEPSPAKPKSAGLWGDE